MLVFGLLLDRRFPVAFLPRRAARGLGWALLGAGALLMGWFERARRPSRHADQPLQAGAARCYGGPFRYTRNPGYLSMAIIYAGIAARANALWAILVLPVALLVIQRGLIEREERYLERKFGEEYLRYKTTVRRWI